MKPRRARPPTATWCSEPLLDFHQFDLARDVEQADALFDDSLNAAHPDLNAFVNAGGKLLMTHGWNDTAIPPRGSVQYYEVARAGLEDQSRSATAIRLFMVPGCFTVAAVMGRVSLMAWRRSSAGLKSTKCLSS